VSWQSWEAGRASWGRTCPPGSCWVLQALCWLGLAATNRTEEEMNGKLDGLGAGWSQEGKCSLVGSPGPHPSRRPKGLLVSTALVAQAERQRLLVPGKHGGQPRSGCGHAACAAGSRGVCTSPEQNPGLAVPHAYVFMDIYRGRAPKCILSSSIQCVLLPV
jgi:hypothetical protein